MYSDKKRNERRRTMTFALSGYMLYIMWAVLCIIGVDLLVGIFKSIMNKTFSISTLANFLKGILYYVFPLMILVNLMPLDPTGWFILILYYVGAVGVIFKYIFDINIKL
jgi:hypothetical protein